MPRHTGYASLPLHGGKAPAWLFGRMVRLSREIIFMQAIGITREGSESLIAAVDLFGRMWMGRDNGSAAEWLWTQSPQTGQFVGTPVFDRVGNVYVGTNNGVIYQLDSHTGNVRASRVFDIDRLSTTLALALDSMNGGFSLVATTSKTLILKYSIPFSLPE